jgi:hypothetical protein
MDWKDVRGMVGHKGHEGKGFQRTEIREERRIELI